MPVTCEIVERDVANFIKNRPNATSEEIRTTIALLEKQSVDDAMLEAIKSGNISKYLDDFRLNIDRDYYNAPKEIRGRISLKEWRQNALDELADSDRYIANNIYKAMLDGRINRGEISALIERGLMTASVRKEYEQLDGASKAYAQTYRDLEKELGRVPTEREILQRIEPERETYARAEVERIPSERVVSERIIPESERIKELERELGRTPTEREILQRIELERATTERIIPESERLVEQRATTERITPERIPSERVPYETGRIIQEGGRYVPPEYPPRYPPTERPPRYPPTERPPPVKPPIRPPFITEPFDKEKIMSVYKGRVAWYQGQLRQGRNLKEQWYLISPPYKTEKDIVRMFQRPEGAYAVKGIGAAFKTIQALTGEVPAFLLGIDWGYYDLTVIAPTRIGDRAALKFRKDIDNKTKLPLSVKMIRTV